MHTKLTALVRVMTFAAMGTAPLFAQLMIRGAEPLAGLVRHTRSVLSKHAAAGSAPTTAHELWRLVVAHLRLGDAKAARSLLLHHDDDNDASSDPALVLATFATMQRTTGERLLSVPRRIALERALHHQEQQPFATFSAAALQVHGRYCLLQLDDHAQRSQHERIATGRLLALECETWQPGRGHYRPIPCHGELRLPAAADASLLLPLSFGMLIATGDRMTRHLSSTLEAAGHADQHRWQGDVLKTDSAALCLIAAAQLSDAQRTAQAFGEVVAKRSPCPETAALNLDAALQAITGMRLAAGHGLNDWLRVQPWLPADLQRVELDGLLAMGQHLTLVLERPDPTSALHVLISMQQPTTASQPVVVGNRWQQFVSTVSSEHPFDCELPTGPETSTRSKANSKQ